MVFLQPQNTVVICNLYASKIYLSFTPFACTTFIRLDALSILCIYKSATYHKHEPLPYSKPVTQDSFKLSGAANSWITYGWLMILGSINSF